MMSTEINTERAYDLSKFFGSPLSKLGRCRFSFVIEKAIRNPGIKQISGAMEATYDKNTHVVICTNIPCPMSQGHKLGKACPICG